jgi:ribosomal-protein-alanine N-acetyltransferase
VIAAEQTEITATPAVGLRPLRWWDLDEVVAVERAAFAGAQPWSAESFWAELAGVPDRRLYLVATDGHVVGFAGLAWSDDTADVMTIAVTPQRARQGIGTTLLDALLRAADDRRAREVLLEVRADNRPARALYERAGFVAIARRRGYYPGGVDGVLMRRRGR